MDPAQDLCERFASAFNAGDLAGLKALLHPDATAEVLASGFPVETGADAIATTSLPYLLELDEGGTRLRARAWVHEEDRYVLLLVGEALDTAVHVRTRGDRIERLEYVVEPHQPERLQELARQAGIAGD